MSLKLLHLTTPLQGRKLAIRADDILSVSDGLNCRSVDLPCGAVNVAETYEVILRLWGEALSD